jgi:WD40 repeat protein
MRTWKIASFRSSICLHPSNKIIVALGSDDGSVEIFLFPHLVRLTTLKSFHKLIQSLAWHPAHFMDMEKESKYTDHLAVASNDSDIHIFDLSDVIKRASVENGDSSSEVLPSSLSSSDVVTSADVTLSGHLTRVISLSWSPHEEGKLVSVAYDATAQVRKYEVL